MTVDVEDFELRLRILLPDTYQVFDDEVLPRSMGSAGLQFDENGKVRWDRMWASFCDLAMAGGPPHRGRLLEPFRGALSPEQQAQMEAATEEICRGIGLVTGLCAEAAPTSGWLGMYCTSAVMANWLSRAIMMENVTAVAQGLTLLLPTGPDFRVEKEIKNVITSVAKTCHYWQDHMSDEKHDRIAALLAKMDREQPLLRPAIVGIEETVEVRGRIKQFVEPETALEFESQYEDWAGLQCGTVPTAVWMMRALAAQNCIARREGATVFVPMNPEQDPEGSLVVGAIGTAYRLAQQYGLFNAEA